MTTETAEAKRDFIKEGEKDYQDWRASLLDTPEKRALYKQVAAKCDLWLQLVEARQACCLTQRELAKRVGVSQAQVARIQKRGHDCHTLSSLRHYIQALGGDYSLELRCNIRIPNLMGRIAVPVPCVHLQDIVQ